ncbi:hypothetical protein IWQ61_001968 [Dispira simplex]|nr:hypothetical protein IWQ61_001968 [Dispira simplex]
MKLQRRALLPSLGAIARFVTKAASRLRGKFTRKKNAETPPATNVASGGTPPATNVASGGTPPATNVASGGTPPATNVASGGTPPATNVASGGTPPATNVASGGTPPATNVASVNDKKPEEQAGQSVPGNDPGPPATEQAAYVHSQGSGVQTAQQVILN